MGHNYVFGTRLSPFLMVDKPDFHIVEVSPESIRRGSEEYMEMEYLLWKEFQEKFPEEDLLVSEPDRINNMENLIFEI